MKDVYLVLRERMRNWGKNDAFLTKTVRSINDLGMIDRDLLIVEAYQS
jgi:hypothetical protein